MEEFDFYEHLEDEHPDITLTPLDGCRSCQEALTMSQFALPGTSMYRRDGRYVEPIRLHVVHHLLEQTAAMAAPGRGAGVLASGHAFTAYLYHRRSGETGQQHHCSPDRGHRYQVAAELTAPVALLTDEQAVAFSTVIAELERDLQYRELDRLAEENPEMAVYDLYSLARWVHAAIASRLGAGLGDHLSVRVEAPEAGPGPAQTFPSPR